MSPEPPRPTRILLIKPSSLGDIIHALPVLAALRESYPEAHISWLVSSGFVPLLIGHPLLNEVIPFDRRRFGRMLQNPRVLLEFLGFVRALRKRRFDLVIDLQGLARSGFLAWASGARRRVGFANARELATLFYTQRVRPPVTAMHAVDRNVALGAALGLSDAAARFPMPINEHDDQTALTKLSAATPMVIARFTAVLPGARWESKLWPAERWAALIDRRHADGAPPAVMLGGPDERGRADVIRAACRAPLVDLVGRTSLRELIALLARAELVLCQDSGPMHIAAALGRPLVAVFGPTDPRKTGPYARNVRVVRTDISCAPCHKRICPLGHHGCMTGVSADALVAAAAELGSGPLLADITGPCDGKANRADSAAGT